jgi:pyruvate kinase
VDLIALSVYHAQDHRPTATVLVPTHSGATARSIARFRLPMWVTALSHLHTTCQALQLSYGVHPLQCERYPEDWNAFARDWVREQGLAGSIALLVAGPSREHPDQNHRLEIIELSNTSEGEGLS